MATTRGLADLGPDDLARYTVFLRRVAQSLVGREDGAEDLAQDALLVGLDRGPDEVHRLRAWLGTVCRNLFRANLRSGTRRTLRERECARDEAVPPKDDSADHRAAARAVAEALPDNCDALRLLLPLETDAISALVAGADGGRLAPEGMEELGDRAAVSASAMLEAQSDAEACL